MANIFCILFVPLGPWVRFPILISIYLSLSSVSIFLFICYLFNYPLICLSNLYFIYLSVCLSIYPSVYLDIPSHLTAHSSFLTFLLFSCLFLSFPFLLFLFVSSCYGAIFLSFCPPLCNLKASTACGHAYGVWQIVYPICVDMFNIWHLEPYVICLVICHVG